MPLDDNMIQSPAPCQKSSVMSPYAPGFCRNGFLTRHQRSVVFMGGRLVSLAICDAQSMKAPSPNWLPLEADDSFKWLAQPIPRQPLPHLGTAAQAPALLRPEIKEKARPAALIP